MELLPKEVADTLPPLYSTEDQGLEKLAIVKYFLPGTGWTWYVCEGSKREVFGGNEAEEDYVFFGLVIGLETELGTFTLRQLERVRSPRLGLAVERDLHFEPAPLKELM